MCDAVGLVASLANYSKMSIDQRSIDALGAALIASRDPDTIVHKVAFYPKGRGIVDAASLFHIKAVKTLSATRQLRSLLEQLSMVSEDFDGKAVVELADRLVKIDADVADSHPGCIKASLSGMFEHCFLLFIRGGRRRFFEDVGPLFGQALTYEEWVKVTTAPRRSLLSWFSTAPVFLQATNLRGMFDDRVFAALEHFVAVGKLHKILISYPEHTSRKDFDVNEAMRFMKGVKTDMNLSLGVAGFLGNEFVAVLKKFQATCPLFSGTDHDDSAQRIKVALQPRVQKLFANLLAKLAHPLFSGDWVGDDMVDDKDVPNAKEVHHIDHHYFTELCAFADEVPDGKLKDELLYLSAFCQVRFHIDSAVEALNHVEDPSMKSVKGFAALLSAMHILKVHL